MFWRKYWIFWWSISFKAFPIFFCALAKLDPLSLCRALKFPLLVINRRRACMNESVSMLHVRSVCTAMLAKHVKSAPYLLSSFLPSFIKNGSNMPTSQLLNGGQSNVLSFGRSTTLQSIWGCCHLCQVILDEYHWGVHLNLPQPSINLFHQCMDQGYICHFFFLTIFSHLYYHPSDDLFLYWRLAADTI